VIGLAMAAQGATEKVVGLSDDGELSEKLERMHRDASAPATGGSRS
jgi:hypothetical protein